MVRIMEADEALKDIRHSLHELAQPLAAVTGLIDLLLLEQQGDGSFHTDVELISQKLEKVLQIVAHIREMARMATQREEERLYLQERSPAKGGRPGV